VSRDSAWFGAACTWCRSRALARSLNEAQAGSYTGRVVMDEQVELLRSIYGEMKALNGRVDATNAALHGELGGLRAEVKQELGGLRDEFGGLRAEFKEELGGLRGEVKQELGGLRAGFKEELGGLRAEFKEELGGLRAESREEFLLLRTDFKSEVRRNVERDVRLGTAVAELALDVRELTGIVHAWRDEHRIDREDLRERVSRLERRVGLEPR
jgi:hypothetical protein